MELWSSVLDTKTSTFRHINLELLGRVVKDGAPVSILDSETADFLSEAHQGQPQQKGHIGISYTNETRIHWLDCDSDILDGA